MPLFRPSKSEAVDSDIYIKECLEKQLLPFIRENNPDSNYIFWFDLAGCHYSKQTVTWMDENVKFVSKEFNSPNFLQGHSIEIVWGCLLQKVYEGGYYGAAVNSSIQILESLLEGVKAKVKSIGDNGVYALFK